MKNDLLETVVTGLEARKGDWKKIAADLAPDISYSFIAQMGRRKYESEPSYSRLKLIAKYLSR